MRLSFVRSAKTAEMFSLILYLVGWCLLTFSKRRSCACLMRSHRNSRLVKRQLKIERLMEKHRLLENTMIDQLVAQFDIQKVKISPSWVFKLKEPTESEKGVVLFKFNDTFSVLRKLYDIEKILKDYFLVLEPSHSGYCFPAILQYLAYKDTPIVVQTSEQKDFALLKRLNSNLIPVEFGASDWVDDRMFRPLELKKEFDCVMVAMWNDVKRHHVLLKALRSINDPSLRAALLGDTWNLTKADMEAMADFYGVRRNITFLHGLNQPEVNELLNRTKVNVMLSLREGSNKTIFEGLFAGVPCIVLKNNLGVNKNYINEHTGRLIDEKELADVLVWFCTEYKRFRPRSWAEENISCAVTTGKLDKALKGISQRLGEPWTRPLSVKVNVGSYPDYYHEGERLTPFDLEPYRREVVPQ
jgi:hypothetical protein